MAQNPVNILLVEDDQRLANLTQMFLGKRGYTVQIEDNGSRAVKRILKEQPDLVILDLMLPGEDGLSVCRRVRSAYKGPILIFTAQTDDSNQIIGLEIGADDYVMKPIQPDVLLARVRALLRRTETIEEKTQPATIEVANIKVDYTKREVLVDEQLIEMTSSEFDLLWLLMLRAGDVLSRDDILANMRGIEYDGLDRSIDVRISKIRKKIGDDMQQPIRIKTIRGKGYCFVKD